MKAFRSGTFWIFLAVVFGVVIGGSFPEDRYPTLFHAFQFCSKAFIGLIKGLIVPLLFSTIIVGIAQTGDLKAVGRMGLKSLFYFEVVTTIALALGLWMVNTTRPGDGLPLDLNAHPPTLAKPLTGWEIALHAFPTNLAKHAVEADILPIVVFSTLFGMSLTRIGDAGRPVVQFFHGVAQTMFRYTEYVMKLTPVGVFGAMAYNVSHMAAGGGWSAVAGLLARYVRLVATLYGSLALLVILVFIPVLVLTRTPILKFFSAIREPVAMAFSTASSESALPKLLERLVAFGVPARVAGFVVPAGYSFNLDGSTLYLVLASITIAQAAKIELPLTTQLAMVATLMLTSKGVAGVPRATLVIISATCSGFGIPGEAGVVMLLAVDEVMDMARTAVNVTGNALAAVVVAKWEGVFGSELEPAAGPGPKE